MLTQQNEKITRQKAQLIRMSRKVQEFTLDKISFFTNITHEFRTPINLIIGPIERALKLSYNPQVIEQLNFVGAQFEVSVVSRQSVDGFPESRVRQTGDCEDSGKFSEIYRFTDHSV